MRWRRREGWAFRACLCIVVVALGLTEASGVAQAQGRRFSIPAQPLDTALRAFNAQSGASLLVDMELVRSRTSPGVVGDVDPQTALRRLLAGTGLGFERDGRIFVIVPLPTPTPRARGTPGSETLAVPDASPPPTLLDEIVVTAQRRSELVNQVPIAVSAFSARDLRAQQIEGGFDLFRAIPNTGFSKSNFTGYNFSIRGVGTKAVSVSSDPGVAVEFNDTPLIRNRLFEQEYFDIERVEVLRGPQGTLHGRNATAGVVNVISRPAWLDGFSGEATAEIGNFNTTRLGGVLNLPLVQGVLAARLAGAWTERDGYDLNTTTGNDINSRKLWSSRLSVGFKPTDRLRADFIWERFREDDDRSRTGKQLCHRDPGPERIGGVELSSDRMRANFSQGCRPGSLYDDAAFGTPNGLSIPFVTAGAGNVELLTLFNGLGHAPSPSLFGLRGGDLPPRRVTNYISPTDPYGGRMQSDDLREIASIRDPVYRAAADLFELNVRIGVGEGLEFLSQTAYARDSVYSFQDYNRFGTVPVFTDTSALFDLDATTARRGVQERVPARFAPMSPGGVFCDPQIGCADSVAGFDISRAESRQFSHEFRLQSSFDGPLNFSVGVNHLRYETVEDYYVMSNLLTMTALYLNDSPSLLTCRPLFGSDGPIDQGGCIYIDPNPVDRINGEGHNYYRSHNPYRLRSTSAFGEVYWAARETLNVTGGLRYTNDEKIFTPVPTQLLLSTSLLGGGVVDRGLPSEPDRVLRSGVWTGRLGLDWTPDLPLTESTMLYASYSRGYKAGGFNPPGIGFTDWFALDRAYPSTFEPEVVDAFELGAKTVFAGGAAWLNVGAYVYGYRDYQVSRILERSAVNENFDADLWGLELEGGMTLTSALRVAAAVGYSDTSIADGERSIDVMNRTQGDPDLVLVKPWVQIPSNCVAPLKAVEQALNEDRDMAYLCPGSLFSDALSQPTWPNGGEGVMADLGGNELPNAPHWTVSTSAEYRRDLFDGALQVTARADAYWRGESWARPYNLDPYDRLDESFSANLSLWLEAPRADLTVELYVKNVFDSAALTDAFLNSDDSGLTTNIFVQEPRLFGLAITKGF